MLKRLLFVSSVIPATVGFMCLLHSGDAFQKNIKIKTTLFHTQLNTIESDNLEATMSHNDRLILSHAGRLTSLASSLFGVRPNSLPAPITTTTSAATTTTTQHKFKNVEALLDAYGEEPILIYFTSMTCGPCKLQKRELATVRDLVGPDVVYKVISIDTKKWPHVGTRFQIGKLPCLLVMKNKEIITRLEGLTKAEELVEKVYSLNTK